MKKTVYIETTVPSAFVTRRQDAHSLARREDTREWWAKQRADYECFISQEVLGELSRSGFPGQAEAIGLLRDVPLEQFN